MTNQKDKLNFDIEVVTEFSLEDLNKVAKLFKENMGYSNLNHLKYTLENKKSILFIFAYFNAELIAYKLGFESKAKYFESFNGLVTSKYRKNGIAAKMMAIQHDWCKKNNFKIIDTIVAKDNKAMLIANLKSGFEINGTIWDRDSVFKILMQKIF